MKEIKKERIISPYNANEDIGCKFCSQFAVREVVLVGGKSGSEVTIGLCGDHNKIMEVISFLQI